MKTTRRDFIKISSAGVAAAAVAPPLIKWASASNKDADGLSENGLTRTPTYCEVCFWKCAGWTYTDKMGNIKKIVGNDIDPHCNGRLCPRGTGGVGMYTDKDRLTEPMIRTNVRGKQEFKKVTWDEAYEYINEKLQKIKRKYGPECVALFNHGTGGKFFGHLLNAYGSGNVAAPSYAQCRGPREVGFVGTFGEAVGSPEPTDIRDTKCLVLIGSHIGENMHNGQVQEMSDAIDRGATIITVDPRFSTPAGKSKYWLPIKPATDLALLLSWIHVLIYEGWYNKEYVEKYAYGFDELKAHVKDMTPEWAYGITTIKPDVIRKTAREMFNASPSVIIHPGRHVAWYGDDTQRSRAIAILNALLGSWGQRGGFYRPEGVHLEGIPHPPYPVPTKSWKDAFPDKYKLAGLALSNVMCDATIPTVERECSFKGWLVYGTNLIKTLPDRANTIKAIQSLDLLVVIDTMPVEITGYADVILPECTYLERYDLIRTSPHRDPYIALRMPAVPPKGNSKPAWLMAKELGEKMGLGDYFKFDSIEEILDEGLKAVGSSLEEMKKIGVKKLERKYNDLYFTEGLPDVEFNTPSGKIELYSNQFAAAGYEPLPSYTAHPEPPQNFYRLIYGRAPMHTFSRTANNENLTDLMDENTVWINPRVANEWGLKNDQYIWLKNQDDIISTFPIKVRVTERIRWDSIYMVHGFGHDNKLLTRAHGRGASDSELITNVMIDPIMGATGMRGNFVTFLKNDPKKEVVS